MPQNSRMVSRSFVPMYCWMHGVSEHTSAECEDPVPNCQRMETMENRMDGSNYNYGET